MMDNDSSHDFEHVMRVYTVMLIKICKKEGAG